MYLNLTKRINCFKSSRPFQDIHLQNSTNNEFLLNFIISIHELLYNIHRFRRILNTRHRMRNNDTPQTAVLGVFLDWIKPFYVRFAFVTMNTQIINRFEIITCWTCSKKLDWTKSKRNFVLYHIYTLWMRMH